MLLWDGPGTPEAREWLATHRLRSEFGLTAEEAKYEMDNHAEGVLVHLKIWSLIADRQERDEKLQKARQPRGKAR